MAASGHLLILLVPVLCLCEATEYYVRPTEPTNTSCPAQPCLTLNQYVSDSDHYFQSNTVFKFLPGAHHMDRPVTIGNVHNMSLENFSSELPHLVEQFSCKTEAHDCIPVSVWIYHFNVCCAAIWLHDVDNVTVEGLIVTAESQNISGVVFANTSNVSVHLTTTYSSSSKYCIGFAIYKSHSVEIQSSSASNLMFGFFLHANNSHISDITFTNNNYGLYLEHSWDSHISRAIVTHNSVAGLGFYYTYNIHITNTSAAYSGYEGILLWSGRNVFINNTALTHNEETGISVNHMNNVSIISTVATQNTRAGIVLYRTNDTKITNTTSTLNGWNGYYGGEITNAQVLIIISTQTQIYNSSFSNVTAATPATNADPNNLPAIFVLYQSTLRISECHFTANPISAIKGEASNITVSGNLTFSNSRALAGTAFILSQDSVLSLTENSHMYFLSNHADNTGGIFYIVTNMNYALYDDNAVLLKKTNCFLHVEGSRSQKRLAFVNNSAGYGGDILYGGEVALGLDGQWNCLDSFKNISNISQNGLSFISSDPSPVA